MIMPYSQQVYLELHADDVCEALRQFVYSRLNCTTLRRLMEIIDEHSHSYRCNVIFDIRDKVSKIQKKQQ